MYDIIYDIMVLHLWYHSQYLWYPYWYHVWYHIWYHGPAPMISRLYDIMALWYQSTYHKLSCAISVKSSMISYMMTRWLYPPLKTCCIERWIIFCLDAVCRVVIPEVEHTACKNSQISWAPQLDIEWHKNIDNSWDPTVHTQLVLQLIVSEDVKQRAQNYLQFSRTKKFEELLLAGMCAVLSTVVSPFAFDSLFSNRSDRTSRSKLPASQQQWSGLELRKEKWRAPINSCCSNFTIGRISKEANILASI